MAKILIIDDDPFILDMYVLKFKERGFEVETAADAKAGLKLLKEKPPELVLLDIVMPIMDGFAALREIKEAKPAFPGKVVMLTNLGQKEDVERAMQMGADDYIIKAHFTPTEVVDKVESLLQKQER